MVAVSALAASPFEAFVEQVLRVAARAGGAAGGTLALGPLRLRVLGPDESLTARFRRGLAGVATMAAPTLTLHLLAGTVAGVAPPPSWPLPLATRDHQRRRHLDTAVALACWNDGAVWQVLDRRRGVGVYWARDVAAIPEWDYGAPFRTLLSWALADRGLALLHAAGIGRAEGGLLVAGAGGAGKSSTTLAALREGGLGSVGDDFVAVELGETLRAHALFRTLKLAPDALERLAVPADWVANPDRPSGEKARLYPGDRLPGSCLANLPIRALAVPTITGGAGSDARPADGGRLLRALAPSSLFLVPGQERQRFRALAGIAQRLPCYELRLGRDPAALAAMLRRLLEELGHD